MTAQDVQNLSDAELVAAHGAWARLAHDDPAGSAPDHVTLIETELKRRLGAGNARTVICVHRRDYGRDERIVMIELDGAARTPDELKQACHDLLNVGSDRESDVEIAAVFVGHPFVHDVPGDWRHIDLARMHKIRAAQAAFKTASQELETLLGGE